MSVGLLGGGRRATKSPESGDKRRQTHATDHEGHRWHLYAIDPSVDYSPEPTTLVEFRLDEANGGTVFTIVESGFDRIPLARRAEAQNEF